MFKNAFWSLRELPKPSKNNFQPFGTFRKLQKPILDSSETSESFKNVFLTFRKLTPTSKSIFELIGSFRRQTRIFFKCQSGSSYIFFFKVKKNVIPFPILLLAVICPLWKLTPFLTMDSPNPVPPTLRLRPLSTR